MLSLEEIDAAFRKTVEDLKARGADGGDTARVMLAYAGNILLQTDGRADALLQASRLAEELRCGSGFVHLLRDGSGFGSFRQRIDAATPTAGRG